MSFIHGGVLNSDVEYDDDVKKTHDVHIDLHPMISGEEAKKIYIDVLSSSSAATTSSSTAAAATSSSTAAAATSAATSAAATTSSSSSSSAAAAAASKPMMTRHRRSDFAEMLASMRRDRELFDAAERNDVDELRRLVHTGYEVNSIRDIYGWTPLMCASVAGQVDAVRFLILEACADRLAVNNDGKTALMLVHNSKNESLIALLDNSSINSSDICTDSDELKSTEDDIESEVCTICRVKLSKVNMRFHLCSTTHILNGKTKISTRYPYYGIDRQNIGYRMLRSAGWSEDAGLGARRQGRCEPIKTVLKRDRLGVGLASSAARVTHFKAGDVAAVSTPNIPKPLTKSDIVFNDVKERKRRRFLRSYFNS